MKKAVIVHPEWGVIGGGELTCYKFAEHLENNGFEVTVYSGDGLTLEKVNEILGVELGSNVSKVNIGKSWLSKILGLTGRFQLLSNILNVRKIMRKANPSKDTLFIASTNFLGLKNHFCRSPDYMYFHGSDLGVDISSKPWPYSKFLRLLTTGNPSNAGNYLFNSRETFEGYEKLDGEVVHPPIPDDFERKSLDEKKVQAVTVSRIKSNKNLLEGVRITRSTGIDYKIVGIVEDEDLCRRLESFDHVELVCNPSRSALTENVSNSLIGLNPSKVETFSITNFEYLKAGCIPVSRPMPSTKFFDNGFVYNSKEEAVSIIENVVDSSHDFNVSTEKPGFSDYVEKVLV